MSWTAPTTRSTGDLITASIWNVDLTDNLAYLKGQTDRLASVTVDSTPFSMVADTIYQNTSGKTMIGHFIFYAQLTAAGKYAYNSIKIGSATPPEFYPVTITFLYSASGDYLDSAAVLIPSNWYYKWELTTNVAGCTCHFYKGYLY